MGTPGSRSKEKSAAELGVVFKRKRRGRLKRDLEKDEILFIF
jgi:hypothetical protein